MAFAVLIVVLFSDYLFSTKILYGSDSVPSGVAFRTLNVEFLKTFREFPRWNPYILGGLPYIDATHGDTFFPSSIFHFLFPVYRGMGHKLLFHIVLAGVFMMFALRSLRLRTEAVVFGGLTYMLCPIFVSYIFAGQDGKMYVTSLTPLVIGLLERAMRSGNAKTFAGLGLAIGFTILSAQIQMAYHMLWLVGALFLLRLFVPLEESGVARSEGESSTAAKLSNAGRIVRTGLFAASLVVGLLLAAIQLMPAVTYVKHPAGFSVRSDKTDYEHATSWSLHPEELASIVVPEFCNAPRGYWGRNLFKYNSDFMGILTLFLAGCALAWRGRGTRLFYGVMGVLTILYSLGAHTPVHKLFYWFVPQVKLFRAPPLVMFIAGFSFAVLAAYAVHDIAESRNSAAKASSGKSRAAGAAGGVGGIGPRFVLVGYAVAAVLALLGLGAGGVTSFWTDLFLPTLDEAKRQAQAANVPSFRLGALVLAAVLASGVATLEAWRRGRLRRNVAVGILLLLTVIDLWRVDRRFKMVMDEAQFLVPDALVQAVQDPVNSAKYRVMPTAERYAMNELSLFGVESTGGFHDNELAWYRETRMAPEAQGLLAANGRGYPFLRMFNVKYILHDQPGIPNPYEIPGFLPRFRLVDSYEVIEDRSRIPGRIAEDSFDVERSVILEKAAPFASRATEEGGADVAALGASDPGPPDRGDPSADSIPASTSGAGDPPADSTSATVWTSPGTVESYAYRGNSIDVVVTATRPCLLVQSENWFPYWSAESTPAPGGGGGGNGEGAGGGGDAHGDGSGSAGKADGGYGDGRALEIYRANGVIRAIPLEPGRQTIRLTFRSEPFERGKWISLATFVLVTGGIVAGRRRRVASPDSTLPSTRGKNLSDEPRPS